MMIGRDSVGIGSAAEITGHAALRLRRALGRETAHRRRN